MRSAGQLKWTSAADSNVGSVRAVNEDAYLVVPEWGLWAVADGMGGHDAGDVASRMVVEQLRRAVPLSDDRSYVDTVKCCLESANARLRAESARHHEHRVIGSTVVVLLAHHDHITCLWVGDSRLYRLREGKLLQLTRDHSHVQNLIEHGLLQPADAKLHPMANVITRAVGSEHALPLDTVTSALQSNDTYLLCSDGLTKMMEDIEIATLLSYRDSRKSVRALIDLALARGAEDNVTTVVINVDDNGPDNIDSR